MVIDRDRDKFAIPCGVPRPAGAVARSSQIRVEDVLRRYQHGRSAAVRPTAEQIAILIADRVGPPLVDGRADSVCDGVGIIVLGTVHPYRLAGETEGEDVYFSVVIDVYDGASVARNRFPGKVVGGEGIVIFFNTEVYPARYAAGQRGRGARGT